MEPSGDTLSITCRGRALFDFGSFGSMDLAVVSGFEWATLSSPGAGGWGRSGSEVFRQKDCISNGLGLTGLDTIFDRWSVEIQPVL